MRLLLSYTLITKPKFLKTVVLALLFRRISIYDNIIQINVIL